MTKYPNDIIKANLDIRRSEYEDEGHQIIRKSGHLLPDILVS